MPVVSMRHLLDHAAENGYGIPAFNVNNLEQEQAVINAFYGVTNPADRNECLHKRPRRTEDPGDGTHCLVNKTMNQRLVGKGE